ncbi:UDP-glycosyltransferase 86A1 [Sesamum alatum]|uniref:UDP-glycosyltransferase 86A1 n=1 Tax=Sesamum alatum TaxID=300844 RepID=A0AAE1Y6P4_9LAMI|nr:UDP-glycosyltransferase 86A1 [Sesamum alatum]
MFTRMVEKSFEQVKKADFALCNAVDELESEALLALSQKHSTYAIDPINFYSDITKTSIGKIFGPIPTAPSGSILSLLAPFCTSRFGRIGQSSKEDIEELAHGILLSQVYFVWVLQSNIIRENGSDIFPEVFEDVVKDKGLIVPW